MGGENVIIGPRAPSETFQPPAEDVPAARPTARTAMPFLLLSLLGLLNVALPPYTTKIWHLFVAAAWSGG